MKRTIYFFVIAFLGLNLLNAQDYHWPLDTDAKESVASKHGTIIGGVTFTTDAERGGVCVLDGAGSYIKLPVQLLADASDITITCWFNMDSIINWTRVYSFGYSNATDVAGPTVVQTIYLVPRDGDKKLHVTYQATGPWYDFIGEVEDTLVSDEWYFSAFVRNGDTIRFYLNGSLVPGFQRDTVAEDPGLLNDSMNYVGKSHWVDGTFSGMVDDLRIYKSALSETAIKALYGVVGVENSLIATPKIYASNSTLFVRFDGMNVNSASIAVYDILGKQVFANNKALLINQIQLSQGIYIVKTNANGKIHTQKVLVR